MSHKIICIPTPIEMRYCISVLPEAKQYNEFGLKGFAHTTDNEEILILEIGWGPKRPIENLDKIIKIFSPQKINIFGACGALSPEIKLGELLYLKSVSSFYGYEKLIDTSEILKIVPKEIILDKCRYPQDKKDTSLKEIRCLSLNKMIDSSILRRLLFENFKFDVVDFESYAIAEYLKEKNISYSIYRAATDYAAENAYEQFYINVEKLLPEAFRVFLKKIF